MDCRYTIGSDNHCNIKIEIIEFANYELRLLNLFLEISELNHAEIKKLHAEANEILSIVVASIKTMRTRNEKKE